MQNYSQVLARLKSLIGFVINRPNPQTSIDGTAQLGSLIGPGPDVAAAFTARVNQDFFPSGGGLSVGLLQTSTTVYQVAAYIYQIIGQQ
jgi:hypothetical protein